MIRKQVVIPEDDYYKLHLYLCNIAGYLKAALAGKEKNLIELLAVMEAAHAEAEEALELLSEGE